MVSGGYAKNMCGASHLDLDTLIHVIGLAPKSNYLLACIQRTPPTTSGNERTQFSTVFLIVIWLLHHQLELAAIMDSMSGG